jgi:hypothetical protein
VAVVLAVAALGAYALWTILFLDQPRHALRDEGAVLLVAASVAGVLALGFALLSGRVERQSGLRWNARVWTLLTPVAPRAAARARLLARKDL